MTHSGIVKAATGALFGALLLGGCGERDAAGKGPEPSAPAASKVVAFKNEKGQIVCPVMGTVIADQASAASFQDYEGKRYYFCCLDCPAKFKANPAKYAEGKAIGTPKQDTRPQRA